MGVPHASLRAVGSGVEDCKLRQVARGIAHNPAVIWVCIPEGVKGDVNDAVQLKQRRAVTCGLVVKCNRAIYGIASSSRNTTRNANWTAGVLSPSEQV